MKKIVSIFIISSIILTSCWTQVKEVADIIPWKSIKTQVISKDYFNEQIKLVWKVGPIMETPISTLAWWIIKNLNAEVWKEVKQGQLLAQIDLSSSAYWTSFNNANTAYNNSLNAYGYTEESIKNDLESARIQLENAKTAKENTYITTQKQLELSKTQLDNIKKNVSNTNLTTSESLKNSELMLDNSKTNLENFKKNSKENLNSIYENLKVSLSSALITIDSSITQADMILWVTDKNKNANDSYEVYLWAKNSNIKIQAENIFRELKSQYDSLLSVNYGTDIESLDKKTNIVLDLITKDSELYDNLVLTLNNSITSSTFTQTTLDTLSLNIAKIQGSILQSQSQITGLKNTLITTKSSTETNLVSLQNAINIANAQLDNIKAWNNSQIDNINWNETLLKSQLENTEATIKQTRDNVDNAVRIAQSSFDSIQAKLNSQRVQAKSQIDSAKWWKDLAWIQLNNTSIIAPFNWIITARNAEIGTMVNVWTPVFMIWDNSQLKIKLDVSGDNISFLKLGQEAQILKWNNTFTWIITLLSPAADPTTKMFKVEVIFTEKPELINLWDYVDVVINKIKDSEKVILVPFSSIISLGQWDYSIFVVKDWIAKTRQVKIGSQNSTRVQILSWVKEWEKVVISWTLDLQDWDKIEEEK